MSDNIKPIGGSWGAAECDRAWQELRDWLGPSRACVWTQSEYDLWETDCGNAFQLNDGGPHDNDMAICCYCGGALVEQAYEDVRDDDEE